MIRRLGVVAAGILVALFLAVPAGAQGTGTIEGRVTNGTQNGTSVAGVEIKLSTLSGGAEVASSTAQADETGSFRFTGVTAGDYTYQISLTFEEAGYDFDVPAFSDNETVKTVPVTVYDSTDNESVISVVSAHTVLVPGNGTVSVQEYCLIANMSDRTYIGPASGSGPRQTMKFPLPGNAAALDLTGEFVSGATVNVAGGFADTRPIMPGSKEFIYSYGVNEALDRYTYSRPVYYPTMQYNVLVPGADATVTSAALEDQGTLDLGGQSFRVLAGSGLQPGATITVKFGGASGGVPLLAWVGVGVVVALLGAAVALRIIRRRSVPAVVETDSAGQEDALLAELAHLDDEFEAGRLDEDAYRRRRNVKKAELAALLRRGKE